MYAKLLELLQSKGREKMEYESQYSSLFRAIRSKTLQNRLTEKEKEELQVLRTSLSQPVRRRMKTKVLDEIIFDHASFTLNEEGNDSFGKYEYVLEKPEDVVLLDKLSFFTHEREVLVTGTFSVEERNGLLYLSRVEK